MIENVCSRANVVSRCQRTVVTLSSVKVCTACTITDGLGKRREGLLAFLVGEWLDAFCLHDSRYSLLLCENTCLHSALKYSLAPVLAVLLAVRNPYWHSIRNCFKPLALCQCHDFQRNKDTQFLRIRALDAGDSARDGSRHTPEQRGHDGRHLAPQN
jgi:hypothetical protein